MRKTLNKNLLLLLQGNFVSSIGDSIYLIAIGYLVLDLTGSTSIMGALMATSLVPRLLMAPIAGVIVDNYNRQKLIVVADFIRGLAVSLIGIAAFFDFLQIWMLFVCAILLGICGDFFIPSINSALPDIVDKNEIVKANSLLKMTSALASIIGKSLGGFLYDFISISALMLINGLSFILSGISEIFMTIPSHQNKNIKHGPPLNHFANNLKEGIQFTWNNVGLRCILISRAFVNIFDYFEKNIENKLDFYCPSKNALTYYPKNGFSICSNTLYFDSCSKTKRAISSRHIDHLNKSSFFNTIQSKTIKKMLFELQAPVTDFGSCCEICTQYFKKYDFKRN